MYYSICCIVWGTILALACFLTGLAALDSKESPRIPNILVSISLHCLGSLHIAWVVVTIFHLTSQYS